MFTFVEEYEFEWPVTVRYPGADAMSEAGFTARFKLVEEDELFLRDREDLPPAERVIADRERTAERLVGWSGIQTADGTPLPFSPENRDRLLRQRPIREAVTRAYIDAVILGGMREKN